jgi:Zn-dependent oligopeptidase
MHSWVVQLMSEHVEDGSAIPADLMEALCNSSKANAGLLNKRQIVFGLIDQIIHSGPSADTYSVYQEVEKEVTGIAPAEGTNMLSSFAHLTGGYDCSYYG